MDCKVTLNWTGGEHVFALRLGEINALQTACDIGVEGVLNRIMAGEWKLCDLMDTIRLGLIGGGMGADQAAKLVHSQFTSFPLLEFKPVAQSILIAALVGVEDDPVGKVEGVDDAPESGNSAKSTEQAQPTDSHPDK